MKKLLFTFLFLSLNNYAQITFEKGYFITDTGEKTECLIKNMDWKNNPIEFLYKSHEDKKIKTATIKSVKEFVISNTSKYIKTTVNIDRSGETINTMNKVRNPIFKTETLFLKTLIEGEASLYSYQEGNLKRYFFQQKDMPKIKQLIYKKYLSYHNQKDVTATNERYKYQLWKNLKCEKISQKEINNINYKKKSLVNIFIKYNNCTNSKFTNIEEKIKRDLFNLNFRPGILNSSLSTKHNNNKYNNINFDNELSFRLGIEAEIIFPFLKNKWSLILEPTYQYYKTFKVIPYFKRKVKVSVDYQSIEVPVGFRYYSLLNNNSKLFYNLSYTFDFSKSNYIDFEKSKSLDLKIESSGNFNIGIGFKYKNKYSTELRYSLKRTLINYEGWDTNYKSLSLIFGYTIF